MADFDIYFPIFDPVPCECLSMEQIFNRFYPDRVKFRCKASRKRFKKGIK